MPKGKLDFVAVGPFKTGTSWMHTYLSSHPQISLPTKVKETYFFNRQNVYDKGIDWFFENFNLTDESKLIGEFAPAYFTSLNAPKRIYQVNPKCKIIISLREPISQIVSFYFHKLYRGELTENTSLKEALSQKQDLLDNTLYYSHISRWIELFGQDKVKIIFYDLLLDNPQNFGNNLCDLLEVEPLIISQGAKGIIGGRQTAINPQFNKRFRQFIRDLRQSDWHWIVNLGKKIGIDRLIYRKTKNTYQLTKEDAQYILNILELELTHLEEYLKLDLASWKKSWQQFEIEKNS